MMKIGILSDTHGILPKQVYDFFAPCDQIWHAGDIGNSDVLTELQTFKPTHAVFGNIDGFELYKTLPKVDIFLCEGAKILLTHIAGRPGHYETEIRQRIRKEKPNILVCGHSHILLVTFDQKMNLLHINPGACGKQGFHLKRTLVRFDLENAVPKNLEVLEFDKFKP